MPVQHALTFKHGSRGQRMLLYFPETRGDLSQATAAYIREGDRAPTPLALDAPGAIVEVDRRRAPGIYQLAIPDEMLAPGAARAVLMVAGVSIDVDLVAYDPQDANATGIQQLGNKMRHAFLRRAMPGLTEDELAAGERTEKQLTARIGESGDRDA